MFKVRQRQATLAGTSIAQLGVARSPGNGSAIKNPE
jgi:hypothetical protein